MSAASCGAGRQLPAPSREGHLEKSANHPRPAARSPPPKASRPPPRSVPSREPACRLVACRREAHARRAPRHPRSAAPRREPWALHRPHGAARAARCCARCARCPARWRLGRARRARSAGEGLASVASARALLRDARLRHHAAAERGGRHGVAGQQRAAGAAEALRCARGPRRARARSSRLHTVQKDLWQCKRESATRHALTQCAAAQRRLAPPTTGRCARWSTAASQCLSSGSGTRPRKRLFVRRGG